MGIYLLQDELHSKMDTARADFFWHGPGLKNKYHMVKWDALMTPKEFGGLGFTNTRVTNECILAKWIFKQERGDENVCFNLLRKKYLGNKGFLRVRLVELWIPENLISAVSCRKSAVSCRLWES
jgi:hypothetical protein